ncbi:DNRLRE domain-containing protein [Myxococcus sp. K38C18041901]|uniref:DNRLRE domain-containing protein n=1 Tax=Myxococcus guangdongensis TaxID=2906760 RepID=UPI0020A77D77|nr:DNRLRE domain-containing protein [Myxococcus guangdongensis]MCP3062307.1 DNRLRE domain-containing protein [Myxococcus guangdongensis]
MRIHAFPVGTWLFVAIPLLLSGCGAGLETVEPSDDLSEQSQPVSACVLFQRGVRGTVADATIMSASPNAANGAGPLSVDYLSALGVTSRQESLLRFDLSTLPANITIDTATLQLYAVAQTNSVFVHRASVPWSEATVTYASFNQQYSPAVEATILPSLLSTRTANVSNLVNNWVNGGVANNGFLLDSAATTVSVPAIFSSSETLVVDQRPGLEVCYTTKTCAAKYGQCGGIGWEGPTCCVAGSTCAYINDYYSQCL